MHNEKAMTPHAKLVPPLFLGTGQGDPSRCPYLLII